jgi:phage terminase large subunit
VTHRRWGKDDVALHYTAVASQLRVGNYWHMLPEYGQCRKAIWEAINPRTQQRRIDDAFPKPIRANIRTQEMMLKFKPSNGKTTGSTWQLVGSDSYNSLVGSPPIGVVYSEYSIADPSAWDYIRPILLENNGWALFIYTARGSNHGKHLYDFAKNEPGWFAVKASADQTGVFTDEELDRERRELISLHGEEYGEALFAQEYMCSFQGAVLGSYYGKQVDQAEKDGRVCNVPYLIGQGVYTFWDLGIDDSMSVIFMQLSGMEFNIIDYYENSGFGMDHYAKVLQNKNYLYGDHYMPHDSMTRSVQTGITTLEYAENLGIRPIISVARARDTQSVIAGINSGRKIFNRCRFDKLRCSKLLSALEGYSAKYDEKTKKLSNFPAHTWHSHGADAFRTFAVGFQPQVKHKTVSGLLESQNFGRTW